MFCHFLSGSNDITILCKNVYFTQIFFPFLPQLDAWYNQILMLEKTPSQYSDSFQKIILFIKKKKNYSNHSDLNQSLIVINCFFSKQR